MNLKDQEMLDMQDAIYAQDRYSDEIDQYIKLINQDRKIFGKPDLKLCAVYQRGGFDHDGEKYLRDHVFIIYNGLNDPNFKIQYYCEYGDICSETVLSPDQYRQVQDDKGLLLQ